ncbi:hypothetical protein NHH03_16705 [Stieleria sp. TO1_6]|uniref:hypothetical protein n=1 Tax=Stieleria tagensis TaxID=2956795 RepID=UPI00209A78D6|nr:hypothetical protein [Stieleria tagensis]MCO8123393.1 hypothetical protein [Stieleria tagensis]
MALLTKTFAAFGLLLTALSASAGADTYQHIDQLANRISNQTRQLTHESRHYRHTPEYRHLVSDTREIHRLAEHIHEIAHHHGSLDHLASDLSELDSKFHHLESVFDRIEGNARYGHGHVHGSTSHVRRLLNEIEQNIHHLQDDVRSLRTPHQHDHSIRVERPAFYPSPRYDRSGGRYDAVSRQRGSRGRGITIGGGSSRFTIRF